VRLDSTRKAVSAPSENSQQPTTRSFVDSIESTAVRQILSRFPTSEEMARNINSTEFSETLFTSRTEGDRTEYTLPKNIEDFRDSLVVMSIVKLCELKQWIPVLSSKELPKGVLETKDGAYLAGFVSAASRLRTGPLNEGTTKFAKGIRAHQTYSIEKKYGQSRHLRTGGQNKISEVLSSMKGFTKEYWGLRASLVSLFKSVPPCEVTDLTSYVRSKESILRTIKTKLQSQNGGCYRAEELAYLQERNASTIILMNRFLGRLERPDEDLAKNFEDLYAPVKTAIDQADSEVKANLSARARILFPNDNKKKSKQWAQKPLSEKLADLSEDKLKEFLPETLPGIVALPVAIEGNQTDKNKAIGRRYAPCQDVPGAQDVVLSWYSNFDSSLED